MFTEKLCKLSVIFFSKIELIHERFLIPTAWGLILLLKIGCLFDQKFLADCFKSCTETFDCEAFEIDFSGNCLLSNVTCWDSLHEMMGSGV